MNTKNFWLKAILLLSSSLTVMAGATISPSLPQIQQHYIDTPNAEFLAKLVLTIPGLIIAVSAPFSGLIIDRFGRKSLLNFSLILYGISGFSGFFIDDLILLLISRAVLGLSVAGTMTTTITLVGDYFRGKERQAFLGYQGAFMALGGVVYILLGGFLADIDWRYPFMVYLTSFLILPGAIRVIYEPMVKKADKVLKIGDHFSKKWVFINYFIALISMLIFYLVPVYIPFLLNTFQGISNFQVGMSISVSTFFGAVSSFQYNRVKKRLNFFQVYSLVFGLMALAYFIIAISNSYPIVLLGLVLNGLGFGMLMPNNSLILLNLSPEDFRGRILGGVSTFTFMGQFLSPVVFEPLRQTYGSIPAAFKIVSLILALLFIVNIMAHGKLNRLLQKNFVNE